MGTEIASADQDSESPRSATGPISTSLSHGQLASCEKSYVRAGAVFQAAAYYVPVYFISTHAWTLGYSSTAGANFIALSNGTSACGWVTPPIIMGA